MVVIIRTIVFKNVFVVLFLYFEECIYWTSLVEIWLILCICWQDVVDDEYKEEQELINEFNNDFITPFEF